MVFASDNVRKQLWVLRIQYAVWLSTGRVCLYQTKERHFIWTEGKRVLCFKSDNDTFYYMLKVENTLLHVSSDNVS